MGSGTHNTSRLLAGLVTALLVTTGLLTVAMPAANANTHCPTVDATTGAVNPRPARLVDWSSCNLIGADLTRANLNNARLSGANLTGANLTGAQMFAADLFGANLTGADLTGADLTSARLGYANLTNANLTDANLTDASLRGADLTGATLSFADLDDADLTDANLTGAFGCNISTSPGTILPAGYSVVDGCLTATPLDSTPPVVSYTLSPVAPGDGGWYNTSVTLAWSVVDNESTATNTGCVNQSISSEQALTPYTCQATSDGGTSAMTTVTVGYDITAPTVTVSGISGGVVLAVGQPGPSVTATATDSGSGVNGSATCGSINTATVGTKSVTCTATDNAGNAGTTTVNYTVTDAFLGFQSPLPKSTQKAGSTIPVKFTLGVYAGGTTRVTNAVTRVTIGVNTAGCAYSATNSAYQCQLRMPTTKGTYTIKVWQNLGTATNPNWVQLANSATVGTKSNPGTIFIK